MPKYKVTTHYCEDDTDFCGDYMAMELEVFHEDSGWETMLELQDYYHDKSDVVIEAFLDGLRSALIGVEVEYVNLADYDGC